MIELIQNISVGVAGTSFILTLIALGFGVYMIKFTEFQKQEGLNLVQLSANLFFLALLCCIVAAAAYHHQ